MHKNPVIELENCQRLSGVNSSGRRCKSDGVVAHNLDIVGKIVTLLRQIDYRNLSVLENILVILDLLLIFWIGMMNSSSVKHLRSVVHER